MQDLNTQADSPAPGAAVPLDQTGDVQTPAAPQENAVPDEPVQGETPQGQEPEQKQDPEKKAHSKRVQKRIDTLTAKTKRSERENAELRNRVAELEKLSAQTKEKPKPKPDGFENHDEYVEALTDWKVEQRFSKDAEERAKTEEQNANKRMLDDQEARFNQAEAKFMAENPDYEDVTDTLAELVPRDFNGGSITNAILAHEKGPELLYTLGKDLDLAQEVYTLPYTFAIRKLNNIAAGLGKPPPTADPQQNLPDPPSSIQAGSNTVKSEENMTGKELRKKWGV